jgi:hypothetical protein
MSRRIATFLVTALASACVGGAEYSGGGTVETPDLVEVSPGVQVIADYDESIFFADGAYWWFSDGGWYRSNYYTGGWVFAPSPPVVVMRIGEPFRFRHYRPSGYIVHRRPVPMHRVQRPPRGPRIRDHRR